MTAHSATIDVSLLLETFAEPAAHRPAPLFVRNAECVGEAGEAQVTAPLNSLLDFFP